MFICNKLEGVAFPRDGRLAVIGGMGRLGGVLVDGLLKSGSFAGWRITVPSRKANLAPALAKRGVLLEVDSRVAVGKSSAVLVCVKPADLEALAAQLDGAARGKLLISAAAVTTAGRLQRLFMAERVLRAMPTVGAEALCSYTALFAPDGLPGEDIAFGGWLFGSVGKVVWGSEDRLEAHTVMAACAPAFAAEFIRLGALGENGRGGNTVVKVASEFLEAAEMVIAGTPGSCGASAGVSEALALIGRIASSSMALETCGKRESEISVAHAFRAAALLILKCGKSPEEVRDTVASPGGITALGLEKLASVGSGRIAEVFDGMLEAVFSRRR